VSFWHSALLSLHWPLLSDKRHLVIYDLPEHPPHAQLDRFNYQDHFPRIKMVLSKSSGRPGRSAKGLVYRPIFRDRCHLTLYRRMQYTTLEHVMRSCSGGQDRHQTRSWGNDMLPTERPGEHNLHLIGKMVSKAGAALFHEPFERPPTGSNSHAYAHLFALHSLECEAAIEETSAELTPFLRDILPWGRTLGFRFSLTCHSSILPPIAQAVSSCRCLSFAD
jgi:hypothetical protein